MASPALTTVPEPWHMAARLASVLARPLDHGIAPAAAEAAALDAAAWSGLVRHPAFNGPLNRAVARRLDLHAFDLPSDIAARWSGSARSRLCLLLVTEPVAAVRDAARWVAAAALHKAAVRIVLKADRERLRDVLGPDGFAVATQESLLLHAPLAELGSAATLGRVLAPGRDVAAARDGTADFGLGILAGLVALVEPSLAGLFRLLHPASAAEGERLGGVTESHVDHIQRLLRRRVAGWSTLIA